MSDNTAEKESILSLKTPIMLKVAVLGALMLILLIPITLIGGLVREREARQIQVDRETAELWGGEQIVMGPLLTLRPAFARTSSPFASSTMPSSWRGCQNAADDGQAEEGRTAAGIDASSCHHLLPKNIHWNGTLRPEVRSRGLFDSVVYEAELTARGVFELPEDLALAKADWLIHAVDIGFSELQGLEQVSLELAGEDIPLRTRSDVPTSLQTSVGHLFTEELKSGPIEFEIKLRVRGTRSLRFVATGIETAVDLDSSWSSPSFVGSTLPVKRKLTTDGFSASWRRSPFARPFPAFWQFNHLSYGNLTASTFGVSLLMPADQYQQVERALKYSLLFVMTTFGVLLLLEILGPARLHPMHFLLVGAALVLFYLLLIALSEHLGLTIAYGLASSAIVLLLSTYSKSILGSRQAGGIVGGVLAGLYGYLFGLLRAESLALLFGALGLFGLLAMAMYLTRRLDWYTLKFEQP